MSLLSRSRAKVNFLVVLALLVIAALVPISNAYTGHLFGPSNVDAACTSFRVYEDSGSGGSDGNDSWANCADNATLHNDSNGLFLGCNDSVPPPQSDWGDCISRVKWAFTGTTEACLWTNTNYTGEGLRILPGTANDINLSSTFNDKFSSIEIANSNCGAGGAQRVAAGSRVIVQTVGNP